MDTKAFYLYCWELSQQAYPAKHKCLSANQARFEFGDPEKTATIEILTTLDQINGRLYVAFAGSNELTDWWINACFWAKKWEGSKLHRGYLNEILKQFSDIFAAIFLNVDSRYEIIFLGHSKGGDNAQICALMIGNKNCRVITFGAPKPIKKLAKKHAWLRERSTHIINTADFVTTLPWTWRAVGLELKRKINVRGEDHTGTYPAIIAEL